MCRSLMSPRTRVEAAYVRSDVFERLRPLTDDWAACLKRNPAQFVGFSSLASATKGACSGACRIRALAASLPHTSEFSTA